VYPVAPTVPGVPELLDVDLQQLAGAVALVAADQLPGRPDQPGQSEHPVPAQHRVDGAGGRPK